MTMDKSNETSLLQGTGFVIMYFTGASDDKDK